MEIVTISEQARVKAIALRDSEGRAADAVLRVGVQGGGCSGFQYLLEYDERRDDDLVLELDGLTVVIDPFSAPLLAGTVLLPYALVAKTAPPAVKVPYPRLLASSG